jgi:D-3-phosphoglycerate dehydrogenase
MLKISDSEYGELRSEVQSGLIYPNFRWKYDYKLILDHPMPKWKILVTEGIDENGLAILSDVAHVIEHSRISPEELIEIIGDVDALIVRGHTKVTSEVISAAPRLKVIGRAGIGVDNIDLAAANLNNVTVVNSPLATIQAVAEHTLALMFSLARSIPSADSGMKSGLWLKNQLMGIELIGKTLGIIGMGNIGSLVAQSAKSFGMNVMGYDPLISSEELQLRGAEPVTLQDLYTRSDFISLHVSLNPDTRGMINGQSLGSMKRGVHLICTARGGIIDETALLGALETGQVAGAALDVFTQEPPGMSALVSHPRVIVTPHIGAQTLESQARAATDIANEVLAALSGETLNWKVV